MLKLSVIKELALTKCRVGHPSSPLCNGSSKHLKFPHRVYKALKCHSTELGVWKTLWDQKTLAFNCWSRVGPDEQVYGVVGRGGAT